MRLLRLYDAALREPTEPRGSRFELLFARVMGLLHRDSAFNRTLPAPFLDVARRIARGDAATVEHFSYDENRQFLLSDLYDYLALRALKEREQAE